MAAAPSSQIDECIVSIIEIEAVELCTYRQRAFNGTENEVSSLQEARPVVTFEAQFRVLICNRSN